jgi:hypothetical protein
MKIVENNKNIDIIEAKIDKKDIVSIILIENAAIKDTKTGQEYFNGTFLKITNRKGNTRVLDLKQNIDITNMLKRLEIIYNKKTTETDMFTSC